MKQLLTIEKPSTIFAFLLSFLIAFLLTSCGGETSIKGNWTSSDMDRCTSDIISEMKADAEAEEMLTLAGTTMEEFATCACEELEKLYKSQYEATIALDGMPEEEAGMMILSCFGDLEALIKLGMEMEENEVTTEEYGE